MCSLLYGGVDGGGSGSRFIVLQEDGSIFVESEGECTNQWVCEYNLSYMIIYYIYKSCDFSSVSYSYLCIFMLFCYYEQY